jgi:hypothetical protein
MEAIKELRDGLTMEKIQTDFQWLLEAVTENAVVGLKDNTLVWYNGIWYDGQWMGGIWQHGVWEDGEWNGGQWYNGVWENGIWKTGTWHDGIWNGGDMYEVDWVNGQFYFDNVLQDEPMFTTPEPHINLDGN